MSKLEKTAKLIAKGYFKGENRKEVCAKCNSAGTAYCNSSNECECKKDYEGAFCAACKNPHAYYASNGLCLSCPCPLDRSDGTCRYESSLESPEVVCLKCHQQFGGYQCNVCASVYHQASNGSCISGAPELTSGPALESSPALVAALCLSVAIVVILAFSLLGFFYRKQKKQERTRQGLVKEDKFLLTEYDYITHNSAFTIGDDDSASVESLEFANPYRSTTVGNGRNDRSAHARVDNNAQIGNSVNGFIAKREKDEEKEPSGFKSQRSSYYFLAGEEADSGVPL